MSDSKDTCDAVYTQVTEVRGHEGLTLIVSFSSASFIISSSMSCARSAEESRCCLGAMLFSKSSLPEKYISVLCCKTSLKLKMMPECLSNFYQSYLEKDHLMFNSDPLMN